MNMFYNFTLIPVETLEKDGFIVEEHGEGYYSSLKYGDNEALVYIETDKETGEKYLSDIGQWRGKNQLEVVRKLYEKYDIKLVDEVSAECAELFHLNWEGNETEYEELLCIASDALKEKIIAEKTYITVLKISAEKEKILNIIRKLFDCNQKPNKFDYWILTENESDYPKGYDSGYNKSHYGDCLPYTPKIEINTYAPYITLCFTSYNATPTIFLKKLIVKLKKEEYLIYDFLVEEDGSVIFHTDFEPIISKFTEFGNFEKTIEYQKELIEKNKKESKESDLPF